MGFCLVLSGKIFPIITPTLLINAKPNLKSNPEVYRRVIGRYLNFTIKIGLKVQVTSGFLFCNIKLKVKSTTK